MQLDRYGSIFLYCGKKKKKKDVRIMGLGSTLIIYFGFLLSSLYINLKCFEYWINLIATKIKGGKKKLLTEIINYE